MNEATNTVIEKCPDPAQVPFLMEEIWQWIKENEDAKAFAFHYLAVAIHPFAEGNGRTIRPFQQILLLQAGGSITMWETADFYILDNSGELMGNAYYSQGVCYIYLN